MCKSYFFTILINGEIRTTKLKQTKYYNRYNISYPYAFVIPKINTIKNCNIIKKLTYFFP